MRSGECGIPRQRKWLTKRKSSVNEDRKSEIGGIHLQIKSANVARIYQKPKKILPVKPPSDLRPLTSELFGFQLKVKPHATHNKQSTA